MNDSYWRQRAAPIIAKVLADHAGRPGSDIRAVLRTAYPFGPRRYHPYKIWLDEVARQMGRKPPLGTQPFRAPDGTPVTENPAQGRLF